MRGDDSSRFSLSLHRASHQQRKLKRPGRIGRWMRCLLQRREARPVCSVRAAKVWIERSAARSPCGEPVISALCGLSGNTRCN